MGWGDTLLTICTSALLDDVTSAWAVALLLLGTLSPVVTVLMLTVAEPVIVVPLAALALTEKLGLNTDVRVVGKAWLTPAGCKVHVIVPVPPTAGVAHTQPGG